MTIEDFIKKAIEGRWEGHATDIDFDLVQYELGNSIFLDPLAWQAVGKVEEWQELDTGSIHADESHIYDMAWKVNMHRMIDALAEGKSLEEFISTL